MARPVCPGPAVQLVDPIKPTGEDEAAQAEPERMRRVSSACPVVEEMSP